MASTRPIPINLKPARYWTVIGIISALHFISLASIGISVLMFVAKDGWVFDPIIWWSCLLVILIVYDLASLRRVRANQTAGITVLERPVIETGGGVKFVPFGIAELHALTRAMQEDQFPSDPENILRKPDNALFHPGMFEPMRITTGGSDPNPYADDSDMLDVRLTLEPTVAVIWQVEEKGFFEFYINIDGDDWPEKRAFLLKQMRDTTQSELMIQFKDRTASEVLKEQDVISDAVQTKLADAVADWGISICSIKIQNLEPDHATNTAMGLVPQARARRTAAMHEAEGEKQAAIIRSEGAKEAAVNDAAAKVTLLTAKGEGRMAAATALGMTGKEYRASEVAEKALSGKGTILLGGEAIAQAATGLSKFIYGET